MQARVGRNEGGQRGKDHREEYKNLKKEAPARRKEITKEYAFMNTW